MLRVVQSEQGTGWQTPGLPGHPVPKAPQQRAELTLLGLWKDAAIVILGDVFLKSSCFSWESVGLYGTFM